MLTADKLLTVSPTYAKEMSSGPQLGVELDGVIRCAAHHPTCPLPPPYKVTKKPHMQLA